MGIIQLCLQKNAGIIQLYLQKNVGIIQLYLQKNAGIIRLTMRNTLISQKDIFLVLLYHITSASSSL